jgi:DNA-binding NarL/FixJ family response regulator
MSKPFIKVFIADDSLLVREGIKQIISSFTFISIVGESHELANIHSKLEKGLPDILILELDLCHRPMKELLADFRTVSQQIKVLVISECNCVLAIKAGISGYLKKNVSAEELINAVKIVAGGNQYFTPEISQLLANGILSNKSNNPNFSERELEILRLICKGRSNEQMAELLFISEKTIATHRKNIMKKAGVKKSSDLIVWAFDHQIVSR